MDQKSHSGEQRLYDGDLMEPYEQEPRLVSAFTPVVKRAVFKEKCLVSGPFVREHVDVNVHLPQMVTELLLNKLLYHKHFCCSQWFLYGLFLRHAKC